jgi:hypothetical protein
MPTGYTADIKNGIIFEQYAMNCARAFGALIMMRDEDNDAEIPEKFEPSDYHSKAIKAAREELSRLYAMDEVTAEQLANEAWEKSESVRIKRLAENKETLQGYKAMLEKVKNWIPPTEDHAGLHKFMREQLEKSIAFDDMYASYKSPAPKITGKEWLSQEIEKSEGDIEYHTKKHREEVARTDERNLWLSQLRESLV